MPMALRVPIKAESDHIAIGTSGPTLMLFSRVRFVKFDPGNRIFGCDLRFLDEEAGKPGNADQAELPRYTHGCKKKKKHF